MIKIHPERKNITPEKAVRILKRHGEKVSLKEARIMLDFMYNFAILAMTQVLNDERLAEAQRECPNGIFRPNQAKTK